MRDSRFKFIGLILSSLLFITIIILPPSENMIDSGLKVVLSHSDSSVFEELKIKDLSNIGVDNLNDIKKRAKTIYIEIPKDFSKSSIKGITLSDKKKETLHNLFEIQANAIKSTVAIAVLMALLWISEAIPIPVTSLLPLLLFPALSIASLKHISFPGFFNPAHPFMHYLIILFLASFTIAEAMKKWNLHKRISLYFLSKTEFTAYKVIFSFMLISAFLSMFISNTATTAMMLPIGIGIIVTATGSEKKSNFGRVLMLGMAYASSIGGVATLIGTPPNVVLAGFADTLLGVKISFSNWIAIGFPITVVMLPLTFFILIKVFPIEEIDVRNSKKNIKDELKKLGKLSVGERNTLIIFVIIALLWIFEKWIKGILNMAWIDDAVVGVFGIFLFYLFPVKIKEWKFTMDWNSNKKLPWGTLLLFGGGLSLGTGLDKTGAASYIAHSLISLKSLPFIFLLLMIVAFMVFLTEITSNTASTNMMLPILFTVGLTTFHNPLILMVAGAIAASMAFMLPVATPPNALVFGSGYVKIGDMIRVGIYLNIAAIFIITLFVYIYPYFIPVFSF